MSYVNFELLPVGACCCVVVAGVRAGAGARLCRSGAGPLAFSPAAEVAKRGQTNAAVAKSSSVASVSVRCFIQTCGQTRPSFAVRGSRSNFKPKLAGRPDGSAKQETLKCLERVVAQLGFV